ncbi:hypothetical protein AMATHDRAFT_48376 [Amanita thiersii Skay4041]|uniref:BTB domain-containing protein n=1 Tax=Amanita thiersii Skay4041 TaxID=703135 RepID=A0A2A9NID3_9AGAR|nr:hypothetical protein AMATHDRAFT_48376 [Amanita thiersii Skay4041]
MTSEVSSYLSSFDSESFNDPDADVIFQSLDGTKYRIHRENLHYMSGGFPPMVFAVDAKGVMHLPEDSQILDLLFAFMYPESQPDLDGMSFDVVEALTEAAEKYQVYPALEICKMFMVKAADEHPLEVLTYALDHGHEAIYERVSVLGFRDP